MKKAAVVGLQWGDEGKGKIVDLLAPVFEFVARFNGGANAGHTVKIDDEVYKLHLVPEGIFRADAMMGSNMVVHPPVLVEEIEELRERGVEVTPSNLFIDERIAVTTLYHLRREAADEEARGGGKIGTTLRGIGPTYENLRGGFNLRQLVDGEHEDVVARNLREDVRFNSLRLEDGSRELTVEDVLGELEPTREFIMQFLADTRALVRSAQSVLFVPGQGHSIGLYTGVWPFVTCSDPTLGGIGASYGYQKVTQRVGVAKAYSTRVGEGPFETELKDEIGEWIREQGNEYGTTTGRPRRCGWFDCEEVWEAVKHSDVTEIALTHLDTLSGIPELKIRTRDGGLKEMNLWDKIDPNIKRRSDLPNNAQGYVEEIEDQLRVPVTIISIGAERNQTIMRT